MKKQILSLLAIVTLMCSCGKEQEKKTDKQAKKEKSVSEPVSDDVKPLQVIETPSYSYTIFRVISFESTEGYFNPEEGNQYVVLDISVTNKSKQPLDMAVIMGSSKIKDKDGKKYGDVLGALTAYSIEHPRTNWKSEFDAIWSEKFPAGETHRTTAMGFQAPKNIKEFILSMPESDDLQKLDKKVEKPFSIQEGH